uniref:SOCS box domain-containing protein n=1 Tax=Denticeps clupeoides TaxID=299321 RepID=A0AAY4EZQ2_9TELE
MDFAECYQDTCSALALAARQGDARQVQRLLKLGYSGDVKDNRGWNALHEAAASASSECARLLLNAAGGSDYVNALTHNGETAIYLAAKNGRTRSVRWLVKAGADASLKTSDLSCPLFAAVDGCHVDVVKLLIKHGAEANGERSASGWSCLHQASFKGHAEIVQVLAGVSNLEATDDYGITPLFVAAQYGHSQCVEILAEAGASVNCQATDLATPLLIAAQEGHLSCVEALLHHGANPDLFCNQEQWQLPIHAAAQFGQIRILQRLVDVTCRDCDRAEGKVSPVYLAVLGEKAASLRPLLQAGYSADAQPCPQFGYGCPLELWTGFKICDEQGSCDPEKEIVRSLLAAGAQASERAYVCALRHSEVLPLILDYRGLPGGEDGAKLAKRALLEMWNAAHWLPLLLKAGMDPSLFLNCKMFEETHINVLCFFLEFLNWSTLPAELQTTLTRRLAEMPPSSVPALAHLCRLALRDAAGSDRLAKKSFVQRLPIPSILHDYLQFSSVFRAYRNTFSSPSNS